MKRLLFLFIFLLVSGSVFGANQLQALHGKATNSGTCIASGDLQALVYTAAAGGTLVYNSGADFNGAIQRCFFNVMLGSGNVVLDLNYGQLYYLDLAVNGVDIDFNGSERMRFEANRGQDANIQVLRTAAGVNSLIIDSSGNISIPKNLIVTGDIFGVPTWSQWRGVFDGNIAALMPIDYDVNVTNKPYIPSTAAFDSNFVALGLYVPSTLAWDANYNLRLTGLDANYLRSTTYIPSTAAFDSNFATKYIPSTLAWDANYNLRLTGLDANYLRSTTYIPSTVAWDGNYNLRLIGLDANFWARFTSAADGNYMVKTAYVPSTVAWDANFAALGLYIPSTGAFDSNLSAWVGAGIADVNIASSAIWNAKPTDAVFNASFPIAWDTNISGRPWWVLSNPDTNTQTACANGYVMDGSGTCVEYVVSQTFLPTSIKTVSGTDFNNTDLDAVKVYDLNYYTVREASGANPLQVDVNFSGVTRADSISLREQYIGGSGHEVEVQIWNYAKSTWESYFVITDQGNAVVSNIPIFDASDHNSGGLIQVRFFHTGTGIPSHYLKIDFIWIQKGTTTMVNADHDSLGGRDDRENHPWAASTADSNYLFLQKSTYIPSTNAWDANYNSRLVGLDANTIAIINALDLNNSLNYLKVSAEDTNWQTSWSIFDANIGNYFLRTSTYIPSTAAFDSNFAALGLYIPSTLAFDANYNLRLAGLDANYLRSTTYIPSTAAFDSNFATKYIPSTGAFDSNLSAWVGAGIADANIASAATWNSKVNWAQVSAIFPIGDANLSVSHPTSAIFNAAFPVVDANVANDLTINTPNSAIFRADLNAYGGLNANTIRSFDNNSLSLQTLNTTRLTILSDGNVGIGTTSPGNKLNVIGDTNISSGKLIVEHNGGKVLLDTNASGWCLGVGGC